MVEIQVNIVDEFREGVRCILCFHARGEMISLANDGADKDFGAILCAHFWFPLENIRSESICRNCWKCVEEFHRFYQRVQQTYATGLDKIQDTETCYVVLDEDATELEKEDDDSALVCEVTVTMDEHGLVVENEQTVEHADNAEASSCAVNKAEEIHESTDENNDGHSLEDKKPDNKLSIGVEEGDVIISNHCQLQCDHCGERSSTFLKLMKHVRSAHEAAGYVECCGRRFTKRTRLLQHAITHENPNAFSCEVCDKAYSGPAALQEHMLMHDPPEANIFKCAICDRSFDRKHRLKFHSQLHVLSGAEPVECSACQKTFANEKLHDNHFRRIHGPDEIICEKCPLRFKTLTQFRAHERSKHDSSGDLRRECEVCHRWLKNAGSLRKHMYRHQSSTTPHVCDICGKNAPNLMALRSHKLFVHRKEKSHECSICFKAFKRAFTLKEHMTIHTGNTLYSCPYCSKRFNSSANLHAHKKKVHRKEWEQNRKEYEQQFLRQQNSSTNVDE